MSFLNSDLYHGNGKSSTYPQQYHQQTLAVEEESNRKNQSQVILEDSIRVAAQTNAVAQSTVNELRGQTEQIHRIHRDMAETNDNLKTTEYLINGMQSWWTALKQVFVAPPETTEHHIGQHAPSRSGLDTKNPKLVQASAPASTDQLQTLAQMLDEMKTRAVEANKEVKYQIGELDSISHLVDSNERQLNKQGKNLDML